MCFCSRPLSSFDRFLVEEKYFFLLFLLLSAYFLATISVGGRGGKKREIDKAAAGPILLKRAFLIREISPPPSLPPRSIKGAP